MSENNLKSVIEAFLFSSDRPLTIEKIRGALDNMDAAHLQSALQELKAEYEQANRGLRIVEIAGGFQMVSSPEAAHFLRKLYKVRRVERLSKPSLETLAIIAYKQPLTKLDMETLRNVNVDGVIRHLLDKGLIRISGRKKAPGRPFVFGTTKQFLEHFGLKSLADLPKMEDFPAMAEAKEMEATNEPKEPAQSN